MLMVACLLPPQCVNRCCEKFLNVSARTGARFQELFSEMEQRANESAKAAAKKR
jgi:hypothetical protein